MFGAYEIDGLDPSGLSQEELKLTTHLLRTMLCNSPQDMTLTQYYIHQDNAAIALKPRDDKRSHLLSQRRARHLNKYRDLGSARIFFLPELRFDNNLNSFLSLHFAQNLLAAPFSKEARRYIKLRLSERESVLAYEDDVKLAAQALDEQMRMQLLRLDLTSNDNKSLDARQHWSLIKALHNFDLRLLDETGRPNVDHLNSRVFEGNISAVKINNTDYLKIAGAETVYVRFASIKGFSDGYINEGLFGKGHNAPVSVRGNYIIMTRYRGFNQVEQEKYFKGVKDDVQRNQISPLDFMSGNTKSALEQQLVMSDKDKAILQDIQDATLLADHHGRFEASIAVFGTDINQINATCRHLRAAMNQASVDIVWESAGLEAAFECFLPGSQFKSKREMVMNTSKAAALSLCYKSNLGVPQWVFRNLEGEQVEEAFYVFESNDGVPFHYLPFIGGKCLIIGVGPIRSGKTFKKNTVATHIMKYPGSLYTAIDIDPGTEMIAKFFQDDGSIFRLDDDFAAGFNPFTLAKDKNDHKFKAHFVSQISMMIQANSNQRDREFTSLEQSQVDHALDVTLALPKAMRTFRSFIDHCNDDVKRKLSRFWGSGMYARLYDNQVDAIGSLEKRFCVYNIMGVKDDKVALLLVMNEIVYRVLRTFEDPNNREHFKFLDIDEAHKFLSIPGMTQFLVNSIRTWGKWNAGVSLWTQSPLELQAIPDWSVLRSAVSTFWFMADGNMDRDMYRSVFALSEGQLDAIENLIPKQQAFIYQPEQRISKVVNLHVEPEQRVINTSVAGEAAVRNRNLKTYANIDIAIQKTIEELNFA